MPFVLFFYLFTRSFSRFEFLVPLRRNFYTDRRLNCRFLSWPTRRLSVFLQCFGRPDAPVGMRQKSSPRLPAWTARSRQKTGEIPEYFLFFSLFCQKARDWVRCRFFPSLVRR